MTEKKEIIATSASHESEQKTTTEDQMGEKSDVGEANTTKKEGSTSKSETEGISAKHDESKEAKSIITVDDSKKDTASTKSSDKYTPSTSDYHTQTASIEDTKTKSTKVDKKVVAVKENTKKSNRKSLFDSDSEVSSIGFGESSDSGSNSSSDSDSSEDEKNQSKKRKEKEKKKSKTKVKREGKNSSKKSRSDSSSDSSSDSDDSESDSEQDKTRSNKAHQKSAAKPKKKGKKTLNHSDSDSTTSSSDSSETDSEDEKKIKKKKKKDVATEQLAVLKQIETSIKNLNVASSTPVEAVKPVTASNDKTVEKKEATTNSQTTSSDIGSAQLRQLRRTMGRETVGDPENSNVDNAKEEEEKPLDRGEKVGYKRVDKVWDNIRHKWRLRDSDEKDDVSHYDQFSFLVRRSFSWEGKFEDTWLDINSSYLKKVLRKIMAGVEGVSLVEKQPTLDPDTLFLFLEDIRANYRKTKQKKFSVTEFGKKHGKKYERAKKKKTDMLKHLKVAIDLLDKEHEDLKRKLYPMLKAGLIKFDLVWTLFKPGTIAYTTTYGSEDHPRAFRVESTEPRKDVHGREWWRIVGKYLEYNGKTFGLGEIIAEIDSFRGAAKITDLPTYPLSYHRDKNRLKAELLERGKKFVALSGVHYRSHQGLAFYKKGKHIGRIFIDGRMMVDPAIFRRMHPNYNISDVKPLATRKIEKEDESDTDDEEHEHNSDDESGEEYEEHPVAAGLKVVKGKRVDIMIDVKNLVEIVPEKLSPIKVANKDKPPFTDEDYIIACPVVLGFSLHEKLWLEFTVSSIKPITWNEDAYDGLVIPQDHKNIIRALVESHRYEGARSVDDIVQGKGKGLVAVLHGSPGTGKTLTAESISELLKCPLYMVSVGELGTTAVELERQLEKILDIAHAWGAVLLLDEADIFLEQRSHQDLHRNALVSVFLRLLEYFQGILFLTTNRVQVFDEAFQSRIHLALKYEALTNAAKKSVFKLFIEKVQTVEGENKIEFTKDNLNALSRLNLNGRQIKNTVRMAQALALHAKEPMSMVHIRRVLEVSEEFNKDLKGGTGFEDAMRSYHRSMVSCW